MGKRKDKVTGETSVTNENETSAGAEATAAVEKAKASSKTRGPRGVTEDAVIHVLAGVNPKRDGSRAHKLWGLYQEGMTIKAFADAVEAAGFGTDQATPALVYDSKHGFISIEGYDPGAIIAPKPKKEPKAKKVKGEPVPGEAESQAEAEAEQVE